MGKREGEESRRKREKKARRVGGGLMQKVMSAGVKE